MILKISNKQGATDRAPNYVIILLFTIKLKKSKTSNWIFDAKLVFITPDISFLALKTTTWLPCAIHTSGAFNFQPAKKAVHAVEKGLLMFSVYVIKLKIYLYLFFVLDLIVTQEYCIKYLQNWNVITGARTFTTYKKCL